jgi:hypothetical protein
MERTVAHAQGLEHPYSVAITLLFAAQLSQLRRDPGSARTQAEAAIGDYLANGVSGGFHQ